MKNIRYTLAFTALTMALVAEASALDIAGKNGLLGTDVDAPVFSGDLFNSLTPTFSSPVDVTQAGALANLVDGSLDTFFRADNDSVAGTASSMTWSLDTTAEPLGYSLQELRVYTKQANALVFQGFDIEVRYVGSGSFSKLNDTEVVYPGTVRGITQEDDFFPGSGNTSVYVETIVSADSGPYFATGVAEVRLTIYPVAEGFGSSNALFATYANSLKGMQLTNVEMLGVATIPESSSTTWFMTVTVLALLYLRRRR